MTDYMIGLSKGEGNKLYEFFDKMTEEEFVIKDEELFVLLHDIQIQINMQREVVETY